MKIQKTATYLLTETYSVPLESWLKNYMISTTKVVTFIPMEYKRQDGELVLRKGLLIYTDDV